MIGNVAEILNSEVALYCHLDGEGQPPAVICSSGPGRPLHEQFVRSREGGFVGRALGAKRAALRPLHREHDADLINAAGGVQLTHAAAAPVRIADATAGVLIAAFSTGPQDRLLTLWAMESCAAMLSLCLHHPCRVGALLQTGRLDSLTGCVNYAGLRLELEREINRSTRAELPLSLCFIDLDHFKAVNDRYGHLRGNQVLAEVAGVLHDGVRSFDTLGRFGGDEFVVILPETTKPDALRLAARLRSRISAASPSWADPLLSASVGVAEWTLGSTADELLACADEALLLAKASSHR
jgi:diguanylate cyclase (GGDEF)-like protein